MADHPLRRWERFLGTFDAIDAAIEESNVSREEFRRARCPVVERLCYVTDDVEADELCRVLDHAMAESLLTLQAVPIAPATLTRTGPLVRAVGALLRHDCEQVRGLARDVMSGWRVSVVDSLVKARADMERIGQMAPKKNTTPAAAGDAFAAATCDRFSALVLQ